MNDGVKRYTTPGGVTRYKFILYVGKDATTGHTIQIKKQGFKTEQEAEASYLVYKLKVIKGEYKPANKKKMRFSDLYKMWLKVYRPTVKESTYATTMRYFKDHILKELGNEYVDKLTVLKCQQAVNLWFDDAPRTFKRFIRYASNVLNYGVDLELIKKNPMSKVIRPKLHDEPKPFTDFYDKEELNKFLHCARKYSLRSFIFFRLLAYTGMRKGEALGLKWSDIDFLHNTISISRTTTNGIDNRLLLSTPKTSSSIRTIDIDKATMQYLKEWRLAEQKAMFKLGYNFLSQDNLLFPTINNGITEPSKPGEWNRAICKKYHLRRIKVHGFRHTHASLLIGAGASIKDIQERLGHANVQTTLNIYAHVTKGERKKTAIKFAKYMQE